MTLPPRPPKPVQFIDSAEWEVRDYIAAIERRCDDLEGKIGTLSGENDALIIDKEFLSEQRDHWRSDAAKSGLTMATLCDMVLGEDSTDRSDDALVRAISYKMGLTNEQEAVKMDTSDPIGELIGRMKPSDGVIPHMDDILHIPNKGRPTIAKTPAQEQTVIDHFKAHGVARIRELAELLDVSKGTAHNWLKAMQSASDHKCEHCGAPSVSQFCGTICEVEHRKGEEFQ